MFGLTLVDHLRLTFGHVIYTHRAHSQLARRHARWNRMLQGAEALLMLVVAIASIALLSTAQLPYAIVTAIAASLAMCILILRLVFDFDGSVRAHRTCSARLWHIREQYRALLADLKDGTVPVERARERRDALMAVLHDVYESAPPAERNMYEAARRALPSAHESALTDEEVDRFLPESLQKGDKSAA
jgi:ABC-type transport system involved in cytochrome bd biosynthesis fused ATPase/permease subunit